MNTILLDGGSLSIDDVVNVARRNYAVAIGHEARCKIRASRAVVEAIVDSKKVVYGINTGFGKFSDVMISKDETTNLQKNFVVSSSCGVGKPFDEDITRAAMLLRAHTLCKGYSGVRVEIVETLIEMLNKGVHPVIPMKGSGVGDDIIPLAHLALVLMGMGEAVFEGAVLSGREALRRSGINPIDFTVKEGLSLTNGTHIMTAIGVLNIYDAKLLMKNADIAAAMTLEAFGGIRDAFDERLHAVRPHRGQIDTAKNIELMLKGGGLATGQSEIRVQDPYCIRCVPQVHGAVKESMRYVEGIINTEINAVTDNPVVFSEDNEVISGGNFHGECVGMSLDFLGISLSKLGNISERRIDRLVNPNSSGLPAFLTYLGGLHSGFMTIQYTAASLVSENKVLAHPSSIDSIPSSGGQEDLVSMGTISARKSREILLNVQNIVAIEYIVACQGIDFRSPEKLSAPTKAAYDAIRVGVSNLIKDRALYIDINTVNDMMRNNDIVEMVESVCGELRV